MAAFQKKLLRLPAPAEKPLNKTLHIPTAEQAAVREFMKKVRVPDPPQHTSGEVVVGGDTYRVSVTETENRWMNVYFYHKLGEAWCIFGEFVFTGSGPSTRKQAMDFFSFMFGESSAKIREFISETIAGAGRPKKKKVSKFKKKK